MQHLLLVHRNNCCENVPQCHVIGTSPAFVIILISPPTEVRHRHNYMRVILLKLNGSKTKISAVRQYGHVDTCTKHFITVFSLPEGSSMNRRNMLEN